MDPIDPNKTIQNILKQETKKDPSKPGKLSFDAVFKKRLDADNVRPSKPEPLAPAPGVYPIQFAAEPQSSGEAVVHRIHQLVDTMVAYQKKLSEKGTPLKEMAPLIEQLETQSGSLSAISENAEKQDAKLRALIDQSLMLSTLEISRYRSGYYCEG